MVGSGKALQSAMGAEVRRDFVRKVYFLLTAQLVLTAFIAWCVMSSVEETAKSNPGLVLFGVGFSMVVTLGITCVWSCAHWTIQTFPVNYALLAVFTVAQSVLVGFVCAAYTQESVVIVLGITAAIVLALSLVASCTSVDFTGLGPYLFVMLFALLCFAIILLTASAVALGASPGQYESISPAFETARLVYAGLAALLFSVYIVYDTQLILGGKRHEVSLDDYTMAVITLYLDIINFFFQLLSLLGDRD